MYSLAGFIQLLLILSQSDYLPDLSGIWVKQSRPAVTTTAEITDKVALVPVTVTEYHTRYAVAGNDRNRWILSPALPAAGLLLTAPFTTLSRGRVITTDKLYLMFCRLKIGG